MCVADVLADLDRWLRGELVAINTALDDIYFAARTDVIVGRPEVDRLKQQLLRDGEALMARLSGVPLPDNDRDAYALLGMIGHYLASSQRHEAAPPPHTASRETAWAVAQRLGSRLGVAPRHVFAHHALFNAARGGRIRAFTALDDEQIFIKFNALGVLAYRRAANALREVASMGVSNPAAAYALDDATTALKDVLRFNQELSEQLDVDRFFFNIRPYYKPHRVGSQTYRGSNGGDFAAINEVDVLLGLCRIDDPFYQAVVHEKTPFVPPDDLPAMRTLDRQPSLLSCFLDESAAHGVTPAWRDNARRLIAACRAHGAGSAYHHNRLVKPFLEAPARVANTTHSAGVTSSGPELAEVIAGLQRLVDLRTARQRDGINTAAAKLVELQELAAAPIYAS